MKSSDYSRGRPELAYVFENRSSKACVQKTVFHGITLMLNGKGTMRQGPYFIPEMRPLVWLIPEGTEIEERWQGEVFSYFATFAWRELSVEAVGTSRLKFSWNGHSVLTDRCKFPDANAQLRIRELFQTMVRLHGRSQPIADLHLSGLLIELFSLYLELPAVRSMEVSNRTLARYQALMEEQWADNTSIEEIAERLGTSDACLRRIVRTGLGVSPLQHRNSIRLSKARERLVTTQLSIKQVSREVGINDALYFSSLFKKQFGISPRELIRRYRRVT